MTADHAVALSLRSLLIHPEMHLLSVQALSNSTLLCCKTFPAGSQPVQPHSLPEQLE